MLTVETKPQISRTPGCLCHADYVCALLCSFVDRNTVKFADEFSAYFFNEQSVLAEEDKIVISY